MREKLKLGLLLTCLVITAACSAAQVPGPGTEEWKPIMVEEFGYGFQVPQTCYEGPLLADCKQVRPAERSEDCLCYVNTADPQFVSFQHITISGEETSMASISILSPDTPAFSPGEDADLVQFLQQEWSRLGLENIPEAPNLELDGVPAISIDIPGSPGVAARQEVFFLKDNRLFQITLVDIQDENNTPFYEEFLGSFSMTQ